MLWIWLAFIGFVLLMLALDLGVFHRHAHVVSVKEAHGWSALWVVMGLGFAVFVYFGYERHWLGLGLAPDPVDALVNDGASATVKYLTGYVVEKSLSVDNVFVIAMLLVAASGMATGGRVLHHLKTYAPDPRSTILFAGYQAGGTRGAAMLAGAESIKIHGEYVPMRAEVVALSQLSGHADYIETLHWLQHFEPPPRETFITHGEPAAADALRLRIQEQLGWRCQVPEYQQKVMLE